MSKSTLPSARLSRSDVQRLRAQIVPTASCTLWMGAVGSDGYGKFWVSTPATTPTVDPAVRVRGGRVITPHAAVSALVFGPLPLGSTHLHDCDVRLCVNTHPGHLRRGTQRENVRQAVARGQLRGPKPGMVDVRGPAGASRAIQDAIRAAITAGPTSPAMLAHILAEVTAAAFPMSTCCRCSTNQPMSRFRAWTTFPPTCSPLHLYPACGWPRQKRSRCSTSKKSGQDGPVSRGPVPVSSPSRRGAHPPKAAGAGRRLAAAGSAQRIRRSVQCQDRPWRLYHQTSNVCATDGSSDECSRHRSTCPTASAVQSCAGPDGQGAAPWLRPSCAGRVGPFPTRAAHPADPPDCERFAPAFGCSTLHRRTANNRQRHQRGAPGAVAGVANRHLNTRRTCRWQSGLVNQAAAMLAGHQFAR